VIPFVYLFLGLAKTVGVSALARAAGIVGLLTTVVGLLAAFLPTAEVASVVVFETKMVIGVVGPTALGWWLFKRAQRQEIEMPACKDVRTWFGTKAAIRSALASWGWIARLRVATSSTAWRLASAASRRDRGSQGSTRLRPASSPRTRRATTRPRSPACAAPTMDR